VWLSSGTFITSNPSLTRTRKNMYFWCIIKVYFVKIIEIILVSTMLIYISCF
jgi:hypothetical protein